MHTRRAAALARVKLDFRLFCETIVEDELTAAPLTLAPHQVAIVDVLDYGWQRGLQVIVASPWRGGKTTLAEALALWLLAQDVTLRIKIVSASQDEAIKRVGKIKRIITDSPRYRRLFPHVRPADPWAEDHFSIQRPTHARDESLRALGIETGAMGSGCDVLILDDIEDERTTFYERRRRKTSSQFFLKLLSRLDPGGKVFYIATRWHREDLVGQLIADPARRPHLAFLKQSLSLAVLRNPEAVAGYDLEFLLPEPHGQPRHFAGWLDGVDVPAPAPVVDDDADHEDDDGHPRRDADCLSVTRSPRPRPSIGVV